MAGTRLSEEEAENPPTTSSSAEQLPFAPHFDSEWSDPEGEPDRYLHHIEAGRYEEAIALLERAENPEAKIYLANLYAEGLYGIEKTPSIASALYLVAADLLLKEVKSAEGEEQQKKYQTLFSALEKSVTLQPSYDASIALAEMYAAGEGQKDSQPDFARAGFYFRRAYACADHSKRQAILEKANAILEKKGRDLKSSHPKSFFYDFSSDLTSHPPKMAFYYHLCVILFEEGDEEAFEKFAKKYLAGVLGLIIDDGLLDEKGKTALAMLVFENCIDLGSRHKVFFGGLSSRGKSYIDLILDNLEYSNLDGPTKARYRQGLVELSGQCYLRHANSFLLDLETRYNYDFLIGHYVAIPPESRARGEACYMLAKLFYTKWISEGYTPEAAFNEENAFLQEGIKLNNPQCLNFYKKNIMELMDYYVSLSQPSAKPQRRFDQKKQELLAEFFLKHKLYSLQHWKNLVLDSYITGRWGVDLEPVVKEYLQAPLLGAKVNVPKRYFDMYNILHDQQLTFDEKIEKLIQNFKVDTSTYTATLYSYTYGSTDADKCYQDDSLQKGWDLIKAEEAQFIAEDSSPQPTASSSPAAMRNG